MRTLARHDHYLGTIRQACEKGFQLNKDSTAYGIAPVRPVEAKMGDTVIRAHL
jgi:hypothetical protein